MKKIMVALAVLAMAGIFIGPTVATGCDMAKLENLAAYAFEKGKSLELEGASAVFLEKTELAGNKEKRMYLVFLFEVVNGIAVVYQIHAISENWETSDDGIVTVHQKRAVDGLDNIIRGKPDVAMTGLLVKEKSGKILKHEVFPMSLPEAEVWYAAFIDEMFKIIPVPDILAPVQGIQVEI